MARQDQNQVEIAVVPNLQKVARVQPNRVDNGRLVFTATRIYSENTGRYFYRIAAPEGQPPVTLHADDVEVIGEL